MQQVTMSDYNPKWPVMFKEEAAVIAEILKDNFLKIFHIGSTSVEGLKAKPIIDMLLVVRDIEKLDTVTDKFENIGYEAKGEFGLPGRRYFRKGGNARTHQIHAYQYDNMSEILRHIAFRDYLRHHKDICRQYAKLKTELAAKFSKDIISYCEGKDLFIKDTEKKALQYYWQKTNE